MHIFNTVSTICIYKKEKNKIKELNQQPTEILPFLSSLNPKCALLLEFEKTESNLAGQVTKGYVNISFCSKTFWGGGVKKGGEKKSSMCVVHILF